jgi:hypothetical protein
MHFSRKPWSKDESREARSMQHQQLRKSIMQAARWPHRFLPLVFSPGTDSVNRGWLLPLWPQRDTCVSVLKSARAHVWCSLQVTGCHTYQPVLVGRCTWQVDVVLLSTETRANKVIKTGRAHHPCTVR